MKKKPNAQLKSFPYDLPVELETRANGHVLARCPLLPGCQAQGEGPKEALDRLKNAIHLYLSSAAPAAFGTLETFDGIPLIYQMAEFKGGFYAATGRDLVLKSSNGAPGSWKRITVTGADSKFFTPLEGEDGKEGEGDYATHLYCLCVFAAPGRESALYTGTNLNGAVYQTLDGEEWKEIFATGEDRIHCLTEFKHRLYAGTSSQGRVYAFDGLQWSRVGTLSEVAVTCMGVFQGHLYAGTYPGGTLFRTPDGLNWEEVANTGQVFVQCLKEFKGALYAGTSGPKGIRVLRTLNGKDWVPVYESHRESNLYCLEVFENSLYAGTGNSGRVLKSQDGDEWVTAYAADVEGIRSFAALGDYLYAATENPGSLLRSTFDSARVPEIKKARLEKLNSSSVLVAWETDIPSSSEVHYGEKGDTAGRTKAVSDREPTTRHRIQLTGLKAETEYDYQIVSSNRSSSKAATETASFTTSIVAPPAVASPSHPDPETWEKKDEVELLLSPSTHLAGYYYLLDEKPDTVPQPPQAAFTEDKRILLPHVRQGAWCFHVSGVDEAGNIGTQAAHYRLRIDTEAAPPPSVSSSTHPDSDKWTADPTPVIAWERPQDLSGVKGYFLKADHEASTVPGPGNGDLTAETRMTLGPLEDGLWHVHITTQDQAGNLGTRSAHYTLRIDTKAVAPRLVSSTHPQNEQWYASNQVEIEIVAPHDLSGVEGYYTLVDQEPLTLPTAETGKFSDKTRLTYEGLTDGIWYVHARTKDVAGNWSPQAAHFKVCIDTQASPPQVFSSTHPEGGKWYRDRRVNLAWEDPFEHSGIEGYYYNIDRRADTVPSDKSALFTKEREVSFELTDDGLWYFHITTKDKAGNVDWKAIHFPLRVDTQAPKPVVSSPTHPDENQWSSKTQATFKFSAPDDPSGIAGFYYALSENPVSLDPKTAAFTHKDEVTLEIPRDGVHLLTVASQDGAGNVSKETTQYRIRRDTAAELAEIASPSHADPAQWHALRRVELSWKDPLDLSGIEGYFFTFNRDEFSVPDPKEMTWSTARGTVFTLPDDGVWYFHLIAKDRAGNLGAAAHFKLQVDSQAQAPKVKSPTHPPHKWVKVSAPRFEWDEPSELSGVEGYYVSVDSQPHSVPGAGNGKWITERSINAPALKDGRWYFHAVTKDKVGNISKEATHYAFLIDSQPPKSKMKALPPILDRTNFTVEWEAADPHADIEAYDLQVKTGTGAWADWKVNVPERSGAFQGQDGIRYAFRCRAKDSAGNQENYPEAEMAVTQLDISPPDAVKELKAVPLAGGDIELKWSPVQDRISGTDYYRLYRWVEGGPKEKVVADGQLKGTSYRDPGTGLIENKVYYYTVQAVDKMGNERHEGNQTVACICDKSVGTPSITSPSHSGDDWSSNPLAILTWDAPSDATGIAGYYHLLDQSPSSRPDPETAAFTDAKRFEIPKLESGVWYFHVLAKDKAGNFSPSAAHYRLKIDVEKPAAPQVTSSTHPDQARWYSPSKVQFEWSSAPKLSGLDGFYYLFDQDPNTQPLPAQAQRTNESAVSLKVPSPGTWWMHVAVKDNAGNLSEATHYAVRASLSELAPPLVSSPTHPKEDEALNQFDPVFSWEERQDGNSKVEGYVYRLSQSQKETLTEDDVFTQETAAHFKNVGEGTWYFHIASVGKKGKPSPLTSVRKAVIRRIGKMGGVFLRKDGTTPIPGTKIEVLKGEKTVAAAVTDVDGKFHFSEVPEGRYEVRLYSDQYPVLRLKDIPVTAGGGLVNALFIEDMGLFPAQPVPGPVRFYYFLKEDCQVLMEIFDATGTLIDKVDERKEGGAYNVTIWDAAKMPEGEYLIKLAAKSLTKNSISRFNVKKFKLQKPAGEPEAAARP